MILAISGSPRKNRMIHSTIKMILADCEQPYEIISLAGKKIGSCIACEHCAQDNLCKVKDDWTAIGEKMRQADIIIFGAPNYFGMMNALSHACLERTFSFRHRNAFLLKNKLGISLCTRGEGAENTAVKEGIERFMSANQMEVIGHVACNRYAPCYTCGFGSDCQAGNVVKDHGILSEVLPSHLPNEVAEQGATLRNIIAIRAVLEKHGVTFAK